VGGGVVSCKRVIARVIRAIITECNAAFARRSILDSQLSCFMLVFELGRVVIVVSFLVVEYIDCSATQQEHKLAF
jgi:hypothetical protein